MSRCRRCVRALLMAALIAAVLPLGGAAGAPVVAVSIKPVHGLVAAVMAGIGMPVLVIPGAGTPHDMALKPSQSRLLRDADIVFWIGPELETGLAKSITGRRPAAKTVRLSKILGLNLLPLRKGGSWPHAPEEDTENDAQHFENGGFDPHIWLSPANAATMTGAIAQALAGIDPANADRYAANAALLKARLDALDRSLDDFLAPVRNVAYMVFHDAYQYFERHYRLAATGALAANPHRKPGARRVLEVRRRLRSAQARCLFTEPQFAPALAFALVRGSDVRSATLDPLGAGVAAGPDAYFAILQNLATALKTCLAPARQ